MSFLVWNPLHGFECGQCTCGVVEKYAKDREKEIFHQVMDAKWNDFEGSSESKNEEGQAYLCFMASSDKEDKEEDNSKEVLDFLNSYFKDELVKDLFDTFQLKNS